MESKVDESTDLDWCFPCVHLPLPLRQLEGSSPSVTPAVFGDPSITSPIIRRGFPSYTSTVTNEALPSRYPHWYCMGRATHLSGWILGTGWALRDSNTGTSISYSSLGPLGYRLYMTFPAAGRKRYFNPLNTTVHNPLSTRVLNPLITTLGYDGVGFNQTLKGRVKSQCSSGSVNIITYHRIFSNLLYIQLVKNYMVITYSQICRPWIVYFLRFDEKRIYR